MTEKEIKYTTVRYCTHLGRNIVLETKIFPAKRADLTKSSEKQSPEGLGQIFGAHTEPVNNIFDFEPAAKTCRTECLNRSECGISPGMCRNKLLKVWGSDFARRGERSFISDF